LLLIGTLKNTPIDTVEVQLDVKGVNAPSVKAVIYRIDDKHANAYPAWLDLGKPFYLTPPQVEQLQEASALQQEPATFQVTSPTSIRFQIIVPPQSLINLIVS